MSLADLLHTIRLECDYQDFVASAEGMLAIEAGVGHFHEGLARATFLAGQTLGPVAGIMPPMQLREMVAQTAWALGGTPVEMTLPLLMPCEEEGECNARPLAWRRAHA